MSRSVVLDPVVAPHNGVTGSVSKENTWFIYITLLTEPDEHQSGNGLRRVVYVCKTIATKSCMQMQYACQDPSDSKNERVIKHFTYV